MLGVFFEWRGEGERGGNRSGGRGSSWLKMSALSFSFPTYLTVLEWSFYSSGLKAAEHSGPPRFFFLACSSSSVLMAATADA